MVITQDNIFWHELVGLDVIVTDSANTQMNGLNGQVINETKSMIIIDALNGKPKMIPKINTQFNFSCRNSTEAMQVSGNQILKRPFERI